MADTANAQRRELVGINNTMPGPGVGDARGYVILGAHDSWASPPVSLTLETTEHAVQKETYDYMVRGVALADGSFQVAVKCDDGRIVPCMISVETVC